MKKRLTLATYRIIDIKAEANLYIEIRMLREYVYNSCVQNKTSTKPDAGPRCDITRDEHWPSERFAIAVSEMFSRANTMVP